MGASSEGILFYGLYFGEELPEALEEADDSEDELTQRFAKAAGFTEPDPGYVYKGDNEAHFEWYKRQQAAIKEKFGDVEILYLGHYDYPSYGLSAKKYAAEWGEGVEIDGPHWSSEWVSQLTDACIALDIELSGIRFAWHLSSSYG
jgi:hypothetical protein